MKKKWLLFLPVLAIIIMFVFIPINFLRANPDNLVKNGDFAGGSLSPWNSWGDIRMYQDTAGLYSTSSNTAGISQKINTTEKNLNFSCDISPRYSGSSSGVRIAFNIYKNGVSQGQASGYYNNLTPMQWSHISFKVADFWQQNTKMPYSDFDQIEIIAETYNGCIAFFDNFKLESSSSPGTTLEVTKNATAEGEGYLTWSIEKSVDNNAFTLLTGQTAVANYTVKVTPGYHETGITVSGNINIKNSGTSGQDASITYVRDKIEYKIGDGPWTEITTQDISGTFTIPAGDISNVPYSVSFTPVEVATAYRNTALVGLANCALSGGGIGFQEFSYTTDFAVSGGTITSDAFADLSDSLQGYLGQSWVGDPDTYEYTYSRNIGPYQSPGGYKINNTATVTGKDSQAAITDSLMVKVTVTGKGKITVYKDLWAPDGSSEPLVPDTHKFKITLQKSKSGSSDWENVETKTISDGRPQVFDAEIGFQYRIVEENDKDYVRVSNSGPVSIEKNLQNEDIRLEGKQKYAIIKVVKNVVGPDNIDIADNNWFLVRLKGGSRTMYQPFREEFPTYFVVWPGKYTAAEFLEATGTGYEIKNTGSSITVYSNDTYRNIIKITNKNTIKANRSKITFTSLRDGNEEIYIMNADGSGQTNLTNNPADDGGSSFSPDGSKIVFGSERDGNWEIYIMNADGSGQKNLTNNPARDESPFFSPDGSKIVFSSWRNGNQKIYIMNADGSGQTNLTNNPKGTFGDDHDPSFSSDGSKIIFWSNRDNGNWEIYIMNADGSGQTNLSNNKSNDYSPSFSPDGSKIAFVATRDGNDEIYIMNIDGSGQTNLSNNTTFDWWPSFSPDGSKIIFVSKRNGNDEIFMMSADGSGQKSLTNNPVGDLNPTFYFDGTGK